MNRLADTDAATRGGVNVPRDHDHGARYDGDEALFPKGWDDLDPGRHDATGWGPCEGLAVPAAHDTGGSGRFRWWVRCPGCRHEFPGWSESSCLAKLREHMARPS